MRITKGEKMIYVLGISCLLLTVCLKIFLGASLGNFQMSNEKIRYQISVEKKDVESLTMQVNELTSFDNVQSIVKDLGLAYNNDNIIIVDDQR